MASTRAEEVAEVLWELKRADKVATFSAIAGRAGFSAGTKGRTMVICLKMQVRESVGEREQSPVAATTIACAALHFPLSALHGPYCWRPSMAISNSPPARIR